MAGRAHSDQSTDCRGADPRVDGDGWSDTPSPPHAAVRDPDDALPEPLRSGVSQRPLVEGPALPAAGVSERQAKYYRAGTKVPTGRGLRLLVVLLERHARQPLSKRRARLSERGARVPKLYR